MSLVKLLTQYPQFSARKVRRLATQLAYLENINSKEAKGIADDLMEFNLLQAKIETQLNDDVKESVGEAPRTNEVTERINVTPTAEAIRAIELLAGEGNAFPDVARSAKGIVYGSSFYTDRTIIVSDQTEETRCESSS